jgi:hypothetical protein
MYGTGKANSGGKPPTPGRPCGERRQAGSGLRSPGSAPAMGDEGEERCIAKQFPMAPVTAAGGQGGPVNWEEPRATKKGNVPEGRGVLGGLGTPRVMDPARA